MSSSCTALHTTKSRNLRFALSHILSNLSNLLIPNQKMPTTPVSKERRDQISTQLIQAGATGFLKGTLIALVTGYYLNYRYNHGVNQRFFLLPYKTLYLVSWGVIGIQYATDVAKMNITKELAEEEDLKRHQFFAQELGGKSP